MHIKKLTSSILVDTKDPLRRMRVQVGLTTKDSHYAGLAPNESHTPTAAQAVSSRNQEIGRLVQ